MGADAAHAGNRRAARAIFLALSREHPDDVRVWLGLAGAAASHNEQREALERALAIDPHNERARRVLEQLDADDAAADDGHAVALATAPTTAPEAQNAAPATPVHSEDDKAAERSPFPLLNWIALGVILLLLVALGVILGQALLGGSSTTTAPAVPTPILQPAAQGQASPGAATPGNTAAEQPGGASVVTPATGQPDAATSQTGAATPAPGTGGQPVATTGAPSAPTALAVTPAGAPTPPLAITAAPAVTAPPQSGTAAPDQALTLPMGTPIDHDGWTAVLVRPDYALPLDGAIGDLRPNGRFLLTVVAVSNNSATPRVIPPDMFLLVDAQGRSYPPVPGASTAYLALFERAQRGDLALEDTFEPVVGLRSVPIIFDVPPDAGGLRLTINGAGPAGWPVGDTPAPSAPSGP